MANAKRGYHAELDALEIWIHVARHDLTAADRLIDRFTETINLLAERPHLGGTVDYLLPGLRSMLVGEYLISIVLWRRAFASFASFTERGTSRLICSSKPPSLSERGDRISQRSATRLPRDGATRRRGF